MSELQPEKNEKLNETPEGLENREDEQTEKTYELTAEEMIDVLAQRFRTGDTPHTMEDLKKSSFDVGREWAQERKWRYPPDSYLDESANLVMVARPDGEHRHEETLRFLIDGSIYTVTIPKELRGDNYGSLFDVTGLEEADIPEELRPLIEKFGLRLSEDREDSSRDVVYRGGSGTREKEQLRILSCEEGTLVRLDDVDHQITAPVRAEARQEEDAKRAFQQEMSDMFDARERERAAEAGAAHDTKPYEPFTYEASLAAKQASKKRRGLLDRILRRREE